MAINYPNSLDSLSNPNSTDSLSNPSHSQQHSNANDAIEALQTKVGVDGSSDVNSLDYKVSHLISQESNIEASLGLEGNNNLEISGIEMKTTVDSFDPSIYRTVRYVIQISKDSLFRSLQLDILQDGVNFYTQEVEVTSNTEESLATITLEENNGIINLCVTPVSTEVTARYYRTALKI